MACTGKEIKMIGAIIGDIAGSRFEWHNHKSKKFDFFGRGCKPTDDSIMTIAIAKAVMESRDRYDGVDVEKLSENAAVWMRKIGKHYPDCGYGGTFYKWIIGVIDDPYGSYGNGAAMRVSAAADVARNLEEAKTLARAVTVVTHDHPESIRAVEALAGAIYLAREGMDMTEIRYYIMDYYDLDFTLDSIRKGYRFDVSCQGSVPVAFQAFLESDSFEDAIRNAISVGGDSDTIAAITGALAEAFYGVPGWMADKAIGMLNHHLREIVQEFYINSNVYLGTRFAEAGEIEEETPGNMCE